MRALWLAPVMFSGVLAAAGLGYFVLAQSGETKAGQALYAANCASCHGVNLEGQPDWMSRLANGRLPAPPHDETGHTWHHSDRQLFTIIKFGLGAISPGYESDMPAFDGALTDAEIVEILDYLKARWPERARQYQEARSEVDS